MNLNAINLELKNFIENLYYEYNIPKCKISFKIFNNILINFDSKFIKTNIIKIYSSEYYKNIKIELTKGAVFLDILRSNINPLGRSNKFKKSPTPVSDWALIERIKAKDLTGWYWESSLKENKKRMNEFKLNESIFIFNEYLDLTERKNFADIDFFIPNRLDLFDDIIENCDLSICWNVAKNLDDIIIYYLNNSVYQCKEIDIILIKSSIFTTICKQLKSYSFEKYPKSENIKKFNESNRERKARNLRKEKFGSLVNLSLNAILSVSAAYYSYWWIGLIIFYLLDSLGGFINEYESSQKRNAIVSLKQISELYGLCLRLVDKTPSIMHYTNFKAGNPDLISINYLRDKFSKIDEMRSCIVEPHVYLLLDNAEKNMYWSLGMDENNEFLVLNDQHHDLDIIKFYGQD